MRAHDRDEDRDREAGGERRPPRVSRPRPARGPGAHRVSGTVASPPRGSAASTAIRGEGEEPRDVEVEPVRQDELEADQQRAGQRGELERRLPPREEGGRDRAERRAATSSTCWSQAQVGQPGVVLAPVPERERRVAVDLPSGSCGPRRCGPRAAGSARGRAPRSSRPSRARSRPVKSSAALRAELRIGEPQRRDDQRRELRPPRERRRRARAPSARSRARSPRSGTPA